MIAYIAGPYRAKTKLGIIGNYFTVINLKGEHENHAHVKRKSTAELLCKLIKRKQVPKSNYLRASAKRTTLDKEYIEKINNKMKKDKNKQKYININKGCR